jgi:hypothetical protein
MLHLLMRSAAKNIMVVSVINVIGRKLRQLRIVFSDFRWWPFYIQRRFMGVAARKWAAQWVARRRPPARPLIANSGEVLERAELLKTSGNARLGCLLSAAQTAEIRNFFRALPVRDTYRPELGYFLPESDSRNPVVHTAYHSARDTVLAPYLLALANDPLVLGVVEQYLGCRATLGYLAAWWSYNTPLGAQHAENFHRDVDDWSFIKLFVYLSDVDEHNGPHVYVTRSAQSKNLRIIRRFNDAEVVNAFGRENILELAAPAGEGFLENTFGIHKGKPVSQGRRLMFQAVYSLSPLPYSPADPVVDVQELYALKIEALDSWTNRLYVSTGRDGAI